jgi:hypothetical protein
LAALIAAANLEKPLEEFGQQFPGRIFDSSKITGSLGPAIAEFLGDPANEKEFFDRYQSLRSSQPVLQSVFDSCSNYQPGSFTSIPAAVPVNLYLDNGRIGASGYIVDALHDLPMDAVRRCVMCSLLFAPQRGNSKCCSLRCRQRFNKRESRRALKEQMKGKL